MPDQFFFFYNSANTVNFLRTNISLSAVTAHCVSGFLYSEVHRCEYQ